MKSPIKTALLTAFAVEGVNFCCLTPPIDVGYPPGTHWYVNLIALEWIILHLPGLRLLDHYERLLGCHQANVVMGCRWVDVSVLFAYGYLDTALLLLVVILGFQWISKLHRISK